MEEKVQVIITVAAVGVPALLIVLGWITLGGGYLAQWITSTTQSSEISAGWALIHIGIILYIIEIIIGAAIALVPQVTGK